MINSQDKLPNLPKRKQLRLKGYNYSRNNAYYITICTRDREMYFKNKDARKMITEVWNELPNKFNVGANLRVRPNILLDEFIIMPNHVHGIIILNNDDNGPTHRSAPTLGKIVQWFKTITTNYYIKGVKNNVWRPFLEKLWQRNYYERIIRNDIELNQIREYIKNNSINWENDLENIK